MVEEVEERRGASLAPNSTTPRPTRVAVVNIGSETKVCEQLILETIVYSVGQTSWHHCLTSFCGHHDDHNLGLEVPKELAVGQLSCWRMKAWMSSSSSMVPSCPIPW